jgi:hypothetical protein
MDFGTLKRIQDIEGRLAEIEVGMQHLEERIANIGKAADEILARLSEQARREEAKRPILTRLKHV